MRPTIFTALRFAFVIAAGMVAFSYGSKSLGIIGGAISAVFFGVGAHIIACLGHYVTNRLTEWHYRRKSTTALRAEMNDEVTACTYFSCLIITILLERGESPETIHEYIFCQLNSSDPCMRRAGLANLRRCYPKQAESLKGFNDLAPSEDDLLLLKNAESFCRKQ